MNDRNTRSDGGCFDGRETCMVPNVVPEPTADGSMTLYRADIDEHYGSVKGAIAESGHVYVDSALRYRAALSESARSLRVLEIGFGTGLNSAMSVGAVDVPVHYYSLELFPLPVATALELRYDRYAPAWRDVVEARWGEPVSIADGFVLEKMECDFLGVDLPQDIDVVYYDAFAPEKQPELWSDECFRRVYEAMAPGGVLTTYCAKGDVRRRLAAVGFKVERLAGPVGGKREILRGVKPKECAGTAYDIRLAEAKGE